MKDWQKELTEELVGAKITELVWNSNHLWELWVENDGKKFRIMPDGQEVDGLEVKDFT